MEQEFGKTRILVGLCVGRGIFIDRIRNHLQRFGLNRPILEMVAVSKCSNIY